MRTTVYADILFVINFSMDFLILYITGRLLHEKNIPRKLIFAAAAGGVYSVLVLIFGMEKPLSMIVDITFSMLMCFIAFGYISSKRFVKINVTYIAVNLLMGGAMTVIYGYLNEISEKSIAYGEYGMNESQSDISLLWLVLCAGISALLSLFWGKILSRRSKEKKVELEMSVFGKNVFVSGLCDSGNLVREPLGGRPVVFVKYSVIDKILPYGIKNAVKDKGYENLVSLPARIQKKTRLIPINSVGNDGKVIIGILPDKAVIKSGNLLFEKDICIGIDSGAGDDYSGYGAIVPALLID